MTTVAAVAYLAISFAPFAILAAIAAIILAGRIASTIAFGFGDEPEAEVL